MSVMFQVKSCRMVLRDVDVFTHSPAITCLRCVVERSSVCASGGALRWGWIGKSVLIFLPQRQWCAPRSGNLIFLMQRRVFRGIRRPLEGGLYADELLAGRKITRFPSDQNLPLGLTSPFRWAAGSSMEKHRWITIFCLDFGEIVSRKDHTILIGNLHGKRQKAIRKETGE